MSMFGDPEVVSGARGSVVDTSAPENRKTGTLDLKMARAVAILNRSGGIPVYMSNTSRLQVLIAAGREFVDANGRRRDLPSIRARFNYGLYIPSSSFRKDSKEWREEINLIIDAMESHPKMRLGGLFWRADVALAADKERRYKDAVTLINEDADLKARFLSEVSAEEMDAAVVSTQAKRKDLIEAAKGTEKFKPVAPGATREEIMDRAAASRDKIAKKMRKAAEEDEADEEIIEEAPAPPSLKKKKKHKSLGL